jgi:hypothetical protein
MNASSKAKLSIWLFNPFLYLAGAKALVIGWATILLAGLLGALSKTHFDGVLDIHTGGAAPTWFFISEGFVAWLCLSATLLITGKITTHTAFRVIDVTGTQALARWPTIIISLITLAPGYQRFSTYLKDQVLKQGGNINFANSDAFVFFGVVLGMILLTCWMVFLMYKAYAISCNVTGAKAVVGFIAAMFAAEICSKAFLYWLFSSTRQIG